jgi:hypothetical protein
MDFKDKKSVLNLVRLHAYWIPQNELSFGILPFIEVSTSIDLKNFIGQVLSKTMSQCQLGQAFLHQL